MSCWPKKVGEEAKNSFREQRKQKEPKNRKKWKVAFIDRSEKTENAFSHWLITVFRQALHIKHECTRIWTCDSGHSYCFSAHRNMGLKSTLRAAPFLWLVKALVKAHAALLLEAFVLLQARTRKSFKCCLSRDTRLEKYTRKLKLLIFIALSALYDQISAWRVGPYRGHFFWA